ncbi:MAG TPA: hypothetical protein VF074_06660 [Pyrinomonadaceae bacterium]
MRTRVIQSISSIAFVGFALLTLCFVPLQVHADEGPEESITFVYGRLGIVRDQTLRYTWANLSGSDPSTRDFEPLRIQVRLRAADGSALAQQEATAVAVGHSQSFDFDRNQIGARGEIGTERLQLGLEATLVVVPTRTGSVPKQSILKTFAGAIEVFDNLSGRTTVSLGGGFNAMIVDDTSGRQYFNPKAFQIISAGNDYLVGIAPDQTLRLVIAHVDGDATKPPPPNVTVGGWVLDSPGQVVFQSPQVQIAPNEFHIFDFSASSLPITPEPGTGRKQLRLRVVNNGEPVTATALVVSWLELMDSTGRTTARIECANNLKQIGIATH